MTGPALPAPQESSPGSPYRIGMVCLGNICRSPMADVVLTQLVDGAGLAGRVRVDSCGTGPWHVGQPMDDRAAAVLTAEGYDASAHRGQQLDPGWRSRDLLLAMDADNLREITGGDETDRVRLFRSFDPLATDADREVPDPYQGGPDGFTDVLAVVERTCAAILTRLQAMDLP